MKCFLRDSRNKLAHINVLFGRWHIRRHRYDSHLQHERFPKHCGEKHWRHKELRSGEIYNKFLEYLLGKIQAQEGTKFDDDKDFQSKLLENVVSAKCELSVSDGVGIFMELPNNNYTNCIIVIRIKF